MEGQSNYGLFAQDELGQAHHDSSDLRRLCLGIGLGPDEEKNRPRPTTPTTDNKRPKSTKMSWDNRKDLILIGEVILAKPYSHKAGTKERGKAWQVIADQLRARGFKVDKRAVRERVCHLMDKQREKNKQEKAASGISVDETEEERKIRESIEDLIDEAEDVERCPKTKAEEEKKRLEGTEIRKQACESYGESMKRHNGEMGTPKKKRNNGEDSVNVIKRKMEMDEERRKEEMLRTKEETERRRVEEREREQRFEFLTQQQLQQQQQFQQFIQQQQMQHQQFIQQQSQQSQTMMMALMTMIEKKE